MALVFRGPATGEIVSRTIKLETTYGSFRGVSNSKAKSMLKYGEAVPPPQVDALISIYGPPYESALLCTGKSLFSRESKNSRKWAASGLVISSSLTGYKDMN